jgi:hypothetical protein
MDGIVKTLWIKADHNIAQERLSQVADHMSGGKGSSTGSSSLAQKKGKQSLLEKNPDDVSTIQTWTNRRLSCTYA